MLRRKNTGYLVYRNEKGLVLPVAFTLMAVLAAMGAAVAAATRTDIKIAGNGLARYPP